MHVLAPLVRCVLWAALVVVALLGSAVYHLQLPIARQIARDFTQRLVRSEIRGELVIGRLDELNFERVIARHVSLFDGEGRRIIAADRVELEPDLGQLRRGVVGVRVGRIIGATARLVDNGRDEPSLFTTFDSPRPSKSGTSEPLHVVIERLELTDVTLYGQIIQLHGVRAEHVDAVGRLEVGRTVEVRVDSAYGRLVQPFDLVGEIERFSGAISTDPVIGVKLDALARRGQETASASIVYRSPAPTLAQELDIEIDSPNLSPDTLRRLGFSFARPLAPRLQGRVRLAGPPEQLALEAQVQSAAGNAAISGMISSTQGVSAHIQSQAVELAVLVPDAPDVSVRGLLHIAVPDEQSKPIVHAEVAALRYRGLLVPAFELDGLLEDDGVRVSRARATQGGQIALSGRIGFDGRSDVKLDARFPVVQRDPNLSRYVKNLEGSLIAALHIRTPESSQPARLDVSGRIELQNARYGSVRAARLALSGSAHGDPELPELDLQVEGSGVEVLEYSLGNAHFSLKGGPTAYVAEGEFEAKGQKTFNFHSDVVADRQGFVIQADPIEFSVGSESWRGLIKDLVVINEESLELGLLRLASRAQRLEANGLLRVHGEDGLEAQLQNFDLTAVRALLGSERFPLTHGYADANLELHGQAERPIISVQGAIREAKLPGYEMADLLYTVDYRDGHLELDSEFDLSGRGTLNIAGQGELDPAIEDPREALRGGIYNVTFTGTAVDLTLLPAWKGVLEAGLLDGKIEAQGGLESVTLSGELNAKKLVLRNWAAIDLSSRFQYDHDELAGSIEARDARAGLLNADLRWHVAWQQLTGDQRPTLQPLLANDFQVQGRTADRALDELPFNLPVIGAWPLRGSSIFSLARSAGRLEGTLRALTQAKHPVVDETCQLSSASSLRSNWHITNERADLSFQGILDNRTVATGEGSIAWPIDAFLRGDRTFPAPDADLHGQANIARIEQVPVLCQHGHGELHASWDLRSLFTASPSAQLDLQAAVSPERKVPAGDHVHVVSACETDPLRIELAARTQDKQITWQADAHGCLAGGSALHGATPVLWDDAHWLPAVDDSRATTAELELRDAQLKPWLSYLPGVLGFSAIGSGQITARGQHGKVDYRGQLTLSEGELYAISMGRELRDLGVTLVASGNWMKIDNLHARAGRGSLEAAGGIGFDAWIPRRLQLALQLKDFPIEREGMELAALSGNAALVGDIEATRTRVAVKIHSLAIRLPDASTRALQALEPNPDISLRGDQQRAHVEKPYTIEFAIQGNRSITARRNDFEAALATELALEYSDPELLVGGYIEFRRGTFEVFGKRFELNRGGMRFDASPELDPEVNMVATHQPDVAGSAPVYVNVSGTLSEPQVEFYSDQCPEAAVVLLVSGRCPTETSSSGYSDARGTQDAFAAGIIGGILTLGARRELGGLIPRLAVESSARGTRTRVKAGFEAVPKFMRSLVQRVYIQGALSTADNSVPQSSPQASVTTPDFLIELYFPNSIVGAARVAPTVRSWGLDVTWEP